jgi:hypothetical protein
VAPNGLLSLAADVALYVEQFKPLRHLALCDSVAPAMHSASARLPPKLQAPIAEGIFQIGTALQGHTPLARVYRSF